MTDAAVPPAASLSPATERIELLERQVSSLRLELEARKEPHHAAPKAPLAEWQSALLAQAGEEIRAAKRLVDSGAGPATPPMAVFCMLMQMCFEKMGKAALAGSDAAAFRKHRFSHATGSKLVAAIKRMPGNRLHYRWKAILPLVQELERSHPAIAKLGPHLEYPWEEDASGTSTVRLPSSDLPIVKRLAGAGSREAIELLRLATELQEKWGSIFG